MESFNPNYDTKTDLSACIIIIIAIILGSLAGLAIALEDAGVIREETNKSKLCSCIIHVDSVSEVVTEET